jgi:zinc transporter ZupT
MLGLVMLAVLAIRPAGLSLIEVCALLTIGGTGLGVMLALYAGFFLSMGATDLLPEAHAHPSWKRIGLTVLGVAGTGGVVYLAGSV